jgi:DNA end-binding protein Ku
MPRAIWKGAISFGLVHVPVAAYPASQEQEIDFDWLDKRSMDPVGYKRINKRTGKAIEKDDIVKGVKHEGGSYVVLSDEEIASAYPKRTQTIEIQSFVQAQEVSLSISRSRTTSNRKVGRTKSMPCCARRWPTLRSSASRAW